MIKDSEFINYILKKKQNKKLGRLTRVFDLTYQNG